MKVSGEGAGVSPAPFPSEGVPVKSIDKRENDFDAYMKDGLDMGERVDVALDQAMSETCKGKSGRQSFSGLGPGVPTGPFRGTPAEFREFMRTKREESKHGLRDRKRTA